MHHDALPPQKINFTGKYNHMSVLTQQPDAATETKCYHCHDAFEGKPILFDDKPFCCEGCKTVYDILNQNGLCNYYTIDKEAGISLRGKKTSAFDYLDDPEVKQKLIDFTDGITTKIRFYLPQIHCASCIWLLENLYKLLPAVTASKVDFLRKQVSISYREKELKLSELAALLSSIGYTPEINLGDVENSTPLSYNRTLLYKIGVAGFCFGNIMLLSFPEYLGLEKSNEKWFSELFGYFNLVLSLPVLFYSGQDYLTSAWQGIRRGYLNLDIPLALGMVALFGRSAFEILTHSGAGFLDSLAGLIFFLNTGKWYQQKTYHTLSFERDYKSYFPVAVRVKSEGKESSKPLQKLNIGDIILVRNGEIIPSDGLLLKGRAAIDYSFVSGESEPMEKKAGELLFAGGKQIGETIEIQLTRKVSQSYLTQLWNDDAFHSEKKGSVSLLAEKAGKRFTAIILFVATTALLYWLPKNMGTAINAFTAVLIIACPCAVALSIPFSLGNILRLLGRHQFYLKNTNIIENLGQYTAVVFDKTGTITDPYAASFSFQGDALSDDEGAGVRSLAHHSAHPVSKRIDDYLQKAPHKPVHDFHETPGGGISATVAGQKVEIGSAAFLGLTSAEITGKGAYVRINGVVKGCFNTQNRYRSGMETVMAFFRKDAKTYLLSGDNDDEKTALSPVFPDTDSLRFNQSPKDKLQFVKALQDAGEKVLMIGDGLNDAGALRQSDVGIVIAEDTNNFTPASDAILQADNFEQLPALVRFARSGVKVVKYAYLIAFIYNIVGLSYAVQGALSPVIAAILMPLSSLTIVLFGVGMGNLLEKRVP